LTRSGGGRRGVAIALTSTAVAFTAIGFAIANAPGWPQVHEAFFNGHRFASDFPGVLSAFVLNVKMFLIAEAIILPLALVLAVLRGLQGPVFFPVRLVTIVYVDFFRGIPTILLVLLLGFGVPSLGISWLPSSELFWATASLVLIYTAYVSEVYRAGIESVHPSQDAAARSLGLTHAQSLRYVVVPQAVRRVIPPLLNDFIGLQKDTALVSVLGVIDALQQANIDTNATFNFTPYCAAAVLFVAITIPLTRLTDYLVARERRRRQAGVAT
jgi:polar amino acid transport system permease protein